MQNFGTTTQITKKKTQNLNGMKNVTMSFQKIKEYLCSSPILSIYDHNREVFIYTDASRGGVGTVLKQPRDTGMLHPVAYFLRKLKPEGQRRKQVTWNVLLLKRRFSTGNIG